MNRILTTFLGWFGYGGALGQHKGEQYSSPSTALVEGSTAVGPDGALQISTVWACVWLLANTIATLPIFVYKQRNGMRDLARDSLLWQILHDSPNSRMTPVEFWIAMLLNLLLRGNAYARIERTESGDAVALWPMPADQIKTQVLNDGSTVYSYHLDGDIAVYAAENVLHIKEIGNGTIGMARLDYMRATTSEAANAQTASNKMFASNGKVGGLLMIDRILKPEQREAIKANFSDMAEGQTSRIHVLEADMKYQQINLTPQDQQLLETRRFTVEEICRWFGVPPVLVSHSNVTTWGSGIEQLIDGFFKFTVRPYLVKIEQGLTKRVATSAQRVRFSIEYNFDALLRASLKDRADIYAKMVQNGLKTRNECRQLENDPPMPGADDLTAQVNLAPLSMLGEKQESSTEDPEDAQDSILQSALIRDIETKAAERKVQDTRHHELMTMMRNVNIQPAPAPDLHFALGGVSVQVAKADTPAPIINVTNQVNPTPVDVKVTNEVNPAEVKVDAQFEATIQPADVNITLPARRTDGTITRNDKGEIIATSTVERDV